jgi:WD40 repeat protein
MIQEIKVTTFGSNKLVSLASGVIASANGDGGIEVISFDGNQWKLENYLEGHDADISALLRYSDNEVASASHDGSIRIWNWQSKHSSVSGTWRHTDEVRGLCAFDSNTVFSGSAYPECGAAVWDAKSYSKIRELDLDEKTYPVDYIGKVNCSTVVVLQTLIDLHLQLFDVETWQSRKTMTFELAASGIACGNDELLWVVAGHNQDYAVLIDLAIGELVNRLAVGQKVTAIAVAPSKHVIAGTEKGDVLVWDAQHYSLLHRISIHESGISQLETFEEGLALVGTFDGRIAMLKPESGEEIGTLKGHEGPVWAFARVSPHWVISGSGDRTLRLWDLRTRTEVARLDVDTIITAIARVPGASTIVAGDIGGGMHWIDLRLGPRPPLTTRSCG